MYYGSEINEGKDPTKNISHSSGRHRADERERFACDLHEMLWVGGRVGRVKGWYVDSNVGVCYEPSRFLALSKGRTHFYSDSYHTALAHPGPLLGMPDPPTLSRQVLFKKARWTPRHMLKCVHIPHTHVQIQVSTCACWQTHIHDFSKHVFQRATWQFFKKLNLELPNDQAISLRGMYPREMKTHRHTEMDTNVYRSITHIVKRWKRSNNDINEWTVNKMCSTHVME